MNNVIYVVAKWIECPVYIQSEQNSLSSILGTRNNISHDVTSLSEKFVTTASYTLVLCSPGRLNLGTAELRLWFAGGFFTKGY